MITADNVISQINALNELKNPKKQTHHIVGVVIKFQSCMLNFMSANHPDQCITSSGIIAGSGPAKNQHELSLYWVLSNLDDEDDSITMKLVYDTSSDVFTIVTFQIATELVYRNKNFSVNYRYWKASQLPRFDRNPFRYLRD